jgi:hypothetical protein
MLSCVMTVLHTVNLTTVDNLAFLVVSSPVCELEQVICERAMQVHRWVLVAKPDWTPHLELGRWECTWRWYAGYCVLDRRMSLTSLKAISAKLIRK